MKNLVCLLLLFTLSPGVHAGDKKKKKPDAGSASAPVSAPSGGGRSGGGGHGGGMSGLPGMGQPARPSSAQPRAATRSAPQIGSQAPSRHSANPLAPSAAKSAPSSSNPLTNRGGGQTGATGNSSNPLMRRGGQAGANSNTNNPTLRQGGQGASSGDSANPLMRKGSHAGAAGAGGDDSNPLMHNRRQPSNPMAQGGREAGARKGNPMAGNGTPQAGMNGRTRAGLANQNNAGMGRNRAAQNGRGFDNHTAARNWQHTSHANYRVRSSREVFHNYRPVRHDRVWYTSRYDRVVVVGGGYYYWDAGYWYPAWGYDPAFSLYVYDGPIYSYDNLPPDQVTMNVQIALQDDGYYTGEIDGLVGPKTREALGAYQADHELEVTSAIDEPTVESLGLAQS